MEGGIGHGGPQKGVSIGMYGITPKAKQAASLVIACGIGIIIVLAVAVLFCPEVPPAPSQQPDLISIADMQRLLNERYGAKLKVDGKLGPLTQEAWDKAYNNQMATRMWPSETQD